MYLITAYDLNEKRVAKVLKIARKYLTWIQNSLLEGEINESKFERLKFELSKIIDESEDSVVFYKFASEKLFQKEFVGEKLGPKLFI